MSTLRTTNKLKGGKTVAIGASATNTPITDNIGFSHLDGEQLSIDVVHAAATVATGVTVKLQTSFDGGTTWIDSKTASTSNAATRTSIALLAAKADDQQFLPIRSLGRVVVTSGVGDALSVTAVYVSRRVFN